MSQELAAVAGLGLVAWMTLKLVKFFKESDSMEDAAVALLSMLFIIGVEVTGWEIADTATGFTLAANAYLVALMVSTLTFLLVLIKLVEMYWTKSREDKEFGYFSQ